MPSEPTPPAPDGSPAPRHRSRFGGLWTDLDDALEQVAGRLQRGEIDESQAARLAQWIRDGYVVLEQAVPHDVIDAVVADVERGWNGLDDAMRVELPTETGIAIVPASVEVRPRATKLLHMHAYSAAAREALFAEPVRAFLELVFGRPPMAFSSLLFERGTRQPPHQDTAYVGVSAPLEFAASWIALEDIRPDAGALEYFVGSHKIPETVFDNDSRLMPVELRADERYFYHLFDQCTKAGCERKTFTPRKGDVLMWTADLVHGGGQQVAPGSSRKSLVTHYCPRDREPEYFAFWDHSGKLEHAPGAYYCYDRR